MSQYRPLLRRILGQFELNIEEWVKEIMWYLDIAYLKALDSEFSKESMLVSGLEELVEIFDEMLEGDDIWIHPSLLSRIRYSILPDEMAIYERFSDIIKNFSEDKELAYALLDLVEILSKKKPTTFNIIDYNIQRIFTNPNDEYRNEFSIYYIKGDEDMDEDTDEDTDEDIDEVEQNEFNEYYQNLAPTTESQLDRLKNELAITLCDECLMPTRSHECDCWILQIEGF
ncbi:uncharacterized protein OCT59_008479 [Rhizophagus irregularis]|uniref:uncharacterized protein n=1 Tax=Rhizophagus irregularis TaxID=588596 RepID=UPI000CBA1B4F|nr:hypothetical protein OCT59_008479 [Rhizophagus irregularis]